MESVSRFITQELKLEVNEAQSAVARPHDRKFLGFSFTAGPEVKRVIAPKALDRFKSRFGTLRDGPRASAWRRESANSLRTCGACGHFGFCDTPEVLVYFTRWFG
jgi:RNA-directed DNA polymerase